MTIKTLGGCCARSHKHHQNVLEAVKKLNLGLEVEQLTDANEISRYGLMATPGLVINDHLVSAGKLLSVGEAVKLIKKHLKVAT